MYKIIKKTLVRKKKQNFKKYPFKSEIPVERNKNEK